LLFEKNENAVAVQCYKIDSSSSKSRIDRELKANGLVYDENIPDLISNLISTDSAVIKNEIEKISLFLADSHEKKLTSEMVGKIISPSPEGSLDAFFMSIILQKKQDFINEMNKLQNTSCILIIRALQNFLCRVIQVQQPLGKIGIEKAMSELIPPLFGKARSDFINAVQNSRVSGNRSLLEKAMQIECDLKVYTSPNPMILLFQNLFEELWRK
jgi:DNA polymerase III delta subunit